MRHPGSLPICVVIAVAVAGCGSSGSGRAATGAATTAAPTTTIGTRTVDISMADIRFGVSQIDVKVGETVRLMFHNEGKVVHEAVLGDAARQDAHETEMRSMATSGAMGDMVMNDPDAVSVDPGASRALTHTFRAAGQLLIGCHEPGHYAAGMKVTLNIT